MKIRKILAAVAATAVAVSTMAVTAFAGQDASGLADGTAYLNLNTADWAEFEADWTNAEVTGDGTYTVSGTMAAPTDMGQFNALEIVNGETKFGTTYVVTVDSIKVNGVEIKVADGFTCSADGGGVTTRVNLYNEWNSPDDGATNPNGDLDQRAADGDVMSKSAQMTGSMDAMAGVETIEVTFTVSGIGGGAAAADETPADASTDAAAETTTTAPATGNVPAAAVVSVMAVAGLAAVASKKRK
ncbi:MAG: hypothetical protein NC253_08050 [Ruminococcus sp.]|nr:hypothetical protein [Ruminococcus sp.]MCM1380641.1 hypothetical protein [Muribaculaceae bacterium]MCM1478183.1 hypothetical protein [Muribaculaceae bacterium]